MSERTYGGHGLRRLRMITSTAQADPVTCSVAIKALPDLVDEHDRLSAEVARLREALVEVRTDLVRVIRAYEGDQDLNIFGAVEKIDAALKEPT